MLESLKFWKRKQKQTPLLAIQSVPEWTEAESNELKTFLSRPVGQAFLQRARALQASMAINACEGKVEPKTVAGFSYCLNWMESLTKISSGTDVQSAKSEADESDSLPLENLFATT